MRKLILEEWVSLDGFVSDKDGKLDFFTSLTPEQNKYSDIDQLEFLQSVDTIVLGRKTYELFVEFWPAATTETEVIADKLNEMSKIVFSNTIARAPWGRFPAAMVISGSAAEEIRRLKMLKGKDMVMWGSISLAQSLMIDDLIDEYHIQLCPEIIGGGRKLFAEGTPSNLNLLDVKRYPSGNILLKYQVERRRSVQTFV